MRSIKTILSVSLSMVILLVGFSTAAMYYYQALEKEKSVMDQFIHSELTIFPGEIAVPLWKYDLDGVRILCRKRLEDTRIQSIKITDDEQQVIFQSDMQNIPVAISVEKPILYNNENIGTLEISFDHSALAQLENDIFSFTFYILFVVAGTAIFLVLLLTKWLVTNPFNQIAHILTDLKNEKYNWKFRGSSLKEIHPIIEGLKGLSRELLERKKKIEADTQHLEEYNQTLLGEIDRREKAEIALKQSKKKLQLIIDTSPIGICTVDLPGTIVSTNSAYEQMLGYSQEELRGMSFFDLTHPDCRPKNKEIFLKMRSEETTNFAIEKVYIRKDGVEIDVRLHATAIKDDEGKTKFGTAFVEDITVRKRAERELFQSKQLTESVINGIADPVFVKDEKHCWVMVNDAFCRMFSHNREEMLGKSDYDFFPEDQADIFWEHDSIVLGSSKTDINEEHISIGEEIRIFATVKAPFDNPVTGTRNIVGSIRDITDTRRTEEQFRQSQKMESVGRLAGGVAHDFNNMLGVILGHSDMILEQSDLSLPVKTSLEEIKKASERSAVLTRQLLAFARKQTVAPRVLDLNKTVDGMLKMVQRLIGEDIDLAWNPDNEVWRVKVDPSQVDQILVNLCVNARDAIEGVGKVTIETDNVAFDDAYCAYHVGFRLGEYVLLAVSDSGCGMAPETMDKIFEPFFTTKNPGKGTGLGLATVYGIVKQNNGFINVYSEPTKGTTFKVYLPRHIDEFEEVREEGPAVPATRGHETILLVEDEEAILKMVTLMLQGLDYVVIPADTPGEALRQAEVYPGRIDLLLTDVVMPEMNGRDLANQILSLHPDVKRLFMSGYTANVIAHRGVLDEGVNFIPKPFSLDELAFKLREVLDTKNKEKPGV